MWMLVMKEHVNRYMWESCIMKACYVAEILISPHDFLFFFAGQNCSEICGWLASYRAHSLLLCPSPLYPNDSLPSIQRGNWCDLLSGCWPLAGNLWLLISVFINSLLFLNSAGSSKVHHSLLHPYYQLCKMIFKCLMGCWVSNRKQHWQLHWSNHFWKWVHFVFLSFVWLPFYI